MLSNFFLKQTTAYEVRISDWSSDVCSSDLINGVPAPGYSSDQAQDAAERIAAKSLPLGIKFEWTDLTYQQILAGNAGIWVFPISVLLVFLVQSGRASCGERVCQYV